MFEIFYRSWIQGVRGLTLSPCRKERAARSARMTRGSFFRAFAVTILLLFAALPFAAQAFAENETAFERVIRTETLRCAYGVWPPFIDKNLNTGEISGIYYEILEEMGRQLSIEIEWTEEVPFSAIFEGYKTGRYDAYCSPIFPTPARARASDFTMPVAYAPIYLYARADDARFDNNWQAINDEAVRFAILEGEYAQDIQRSDFPRSDIVSVMNLAESNGTLMMVATGKADVTAWEPITADGFIKANPGVIDAVFKRHLPPELDFYRVENGYIEKER